MAYCNFLLPRTACSQKETESHRERREGMQKEETSERERDDAGERKQAREVAGGRGKRRNVTAPLKHTLHSYTNAGCHTHQSTRTGCLISLERSPSMVEYRSIPPAIQEKPAAKTFAKSAQCKH